MVTRLLAILAAAFALMGQTAPQPASVAGTVTNSVTGEPILRAHVIVHCQLADPPKGQQDYGALTNEKGEFSIAPLPAGQCSLHAERVGFVNDFSGESYSLTSGTHKEGIKLPLIPTGAIAGLVTNAAGEPVEGANVSTVMGNANGNGNGMGATTDDKGEFRIGGLRPGKYRVKAAVQAMPFPPEIRSDGTREQHKAATYYPGSLSAKTAQRVEVKPGAEVAGIDIKLIETPIVSVKGKVIGLPPGEKNVMVMSQPQGGNATPKADGSFAIWQLDPGKYTLSAQKWNGQAPLMSAPVEIEVATTDLENVELRMIPPFQVAGQVRFDDEQAREAPQPPTRRDGSAPLAPPPPRRQVQLFPVEPMNVAMLHGDLGADDSFAFEKAQPRRYRVTVLGTSGYVKSVRVGETETDGDVLDLRGGPPGPVTVTVSSNYCEISGVLSDFNGPLSNATVALVSEAEPTNSRNVRSNDGTYKFRVPPGKYTIGILDDSQTASFGPGGLDLADDGESITLSAGDKITKDLVKHK